MSGCARRELDSQRPQVRADPLGEALAREPARGGVEDRPLGLVDARRQLRPVQHEEDLHRGVPDALVAVQEGMVGDERVAERGRFGRESR